MAEVIHHSEAYLKDIEAAASSFAGFSGILCGCNILVTGATGLIGTCVVRMLLSLPNACFDVYAMGRNTSRAEVLFHDYEGNKHFHFLCQDVTAPFDFNLNFEFIIHAASGASPSAFVESPVEVMKANLFGLTNLFDYGIRHGLKRLLFVSSGEVYGQGDGRAFEETYSGYVDSMQPRSCYPSSKRAAETFCASYMQEYSADFVIARPSHVIGPEYTEKDNRAFVQFFRNAVSGEDIILKSSGSQIRSWTYVVDCASALLWILLAGESGHAYNVADDSSVLSIKELAELVAHISGSNVVFETPQEAESKGYNRVTESVLNADKLKSLGWRADVHVRDGIKHSIEWLI